MSQLSGLVSVNDSASHKASQNSLPVVILAAGRGRRLSSLNGFFSPKLLQKINGFSLAERCMQTFAQLNLKKFIIVVGYERKKVQKHFEKIAQRRNFHVSFAKALQWKKGNGTSLLAAAPYLQNSPFLLTMVDHLFRPEFIKSFLSQIKCKKEIALGIDKHIHNIFDLPDATKVRIMNNSIDKIGKKIRNYNAIDTGLFFCTPLLFDALKRAHKKNDYSLSAGISILAKKELVKTIDVSGYPWIDVDTPAAFQEAEKHLKAGTWMSL